MDGYADDRFFDSPQSFAPRLVETLQLTHLMIYTEYWINQSINQSINQYSENDCCTHCFQRGMSVIEFTTLGWPVELEFFWLHWFVAQREWFLWSIWRFLQGNTVFPYFWVNFLSHYYFMCENNSQCLIRCKWTVLTTCCRIFLPCWTGGTGSRHFWTNVWANNAMDCYNSCTLSWLPCHCMQKLENQSTSLISVWYTQLDARDWTIDVHNNNFFGRLQ